MKWPVSPRFARKTVLFVCVGNSGRSQMAQAFFERTSPGWRATSAGIRPDASVHPLTIAVMVEVGIDVSRNHPQPLTVKLLEEADRIILLDGSVLNEIPPRFRSKIETWNIPSLLGGDRAHVARVRDEIRSRVEALSRTISAK